MPPETEYKHEVDFDDLGVRFDEADEDEIEVSLGEESEEDPKDPPQDPPETDDSPAAPDLSALVGDITDRLDRLDGKIEGQKSEAELKREVEQTASDALNKAKSKLSEHDSKIEAKRQALEEAQESGETKKAIQLTEELADLRYDRREAEKYVNWYSSKEFREKLAEHRQQQAPAGQDDTPEARSAKVRKMLKEHPELESFIDKNRWVMNPRTDEEAAAAEYARRIEPRLKKAGKPAYSKELYDSILAEVSKRFPEVAESPRRKEERSGVTPQGVQRPGVRRGSGKRVTLTAADQANMRKFGLDPSNPEEAREYARNKKSS